MNNLLIAIAVFVITVVGALFAVPYFVDWNSYRSNFEEEASRVIGREVQIDGDVTLNLLPTPYFRLGKVRIADTSGDLTFFKADGLSIKLSIPPMLRGVVEANEIEFQKPILRLAPDATGIWNWQSFAQALASTGYMPSNVTLTSLKITDGVLALHGADGIERVRLEGFNGELSAPALAGPYRFRGAFVSGGAEREIRLATAAPEGDGRVPMRASLRLIDSGATYLLDARVADLMGKPRVEGDLTARLPIAGLWQPLPPQSASIRRSVGEDEPKIDKSEAAFDLKATVKGDVAGAELTDVSLTFEQGGQPQIVTGTVRADWRHELALDMSFASRWLDLDRITGATGESGPIESIAKFSGRLRDFIPGHGKSQVTLAIDQANLGREAIGPIRLSLKRSNDKLDVQELRVALPGGSRGELQGTIFDSSAKALVFNGSLALRGASLARFLTWATGNALPIDARADGAYGLRTDITADNGKLAARDLVGNLSGTTLSGAARYRWEGRPELALELEGPQIDARVFIPAGSSLGGVFGFLLHGMDGSEQRNPKEAARAVPPDLALRISAGQLATATRVYRDVAVAMDLKGGNLKQLQLRLSGDEGYRIELEGNVDDVATRPKGSLRGMAMAQSAAALAPLIELVGLPASFLPSEARGEALAPLRLAGSMRLGSRTATSADLAINGETGAAPVKLTARFDGGPGGWRTGPADITVTLDSADGSKLGTLLLAGGSTVGKGPGRIFIKAGGIPDDGVATLASFEAGDMGLDFRGQVTTAEAGIKAAGELEFRTGDGAPLAALAGLPAAIRVDGMPISGKLNLVLGDGAVGIDKLAANFGGRRLSGKITVTPAGDGRRIDASLDADETSVAGLLAPLLDQRLAIASAAEAAVSGQQAAWPDEPFSAAVFDAAQGNVRLTFKRLTLADGIALDGAKLDIGLEAGRIDVKDISGKGLGGQFKASLQIAKAPVGADVRGSLSFGAALEAFSDGAQPRASGPVKGVLEFAGRGLSPRALMSTLLGQGRIEFGEAKLDALWPGAIPLAVDAALQAEPDKMSAAVRRGLASGLSTGKLSLGQKAFALELADGQLRVKSFAVDTGEGRTTGIASLDLKALTFDSQWRLEAKNGSAAGKQLPPVVITYRGPVAALGAVDPRIDSAALEQELSARKIEHDVEELERLRRLDEQRRQTETERLRKQGDEAPPVQRPALPPGVPIAPSSRETRPATPG